MRIYAQGALYATDSHAASIDSRAVEFALYGDAGKLLDAVGQTDCTEAYELAKRCGVDATEIDLVTTQAFMEFLRIAGKPIFIYDSPFHQNNPFGGKN
jgi:hypothetical protein